jgi:hypothetical protein
LSLVLPLSHLSAQLVEAFIVQNLFSQWK